MTKTGLILVVINHVATKTFWLPSLHRLKNFGCPSYNNKFFSVANHVMTKISLPYYGNKMLFSIASNWSFGHLWSPRVDLDKRFSKTYYMSPLQIQSLAIEKNLVTIQQSRFFIWQPKVNQISHMATEGEPDFSYGNRRWTKFSVNFLSFFWSSLVNESFPKIYYMPPFQIQLLVIEKFQSPSNNLGFLDDDWNPFLINICMVIKFFLIVNNLVTKAFFLSPMIVIFNDCYF